MLYKAQTNPFLPIAATAPRLCLLQSAEVNGVPKIAFEEIYDNFGPFGYFGLLIQNGLYGQKLFKMVQCQKLSKVSKWSKMPNMIN